MCHVGSMSRGDSCLNLTCTILSFLGSRGHLYNLFVLAGSMHTDDPCLPHIGRGKSYDVCCTLAAERSIYSSVFGMCKITKQTQHLNRDCSWIFVWCPYIWRIHACLLYCYDTTVLYARPNAADTKTWQDDILKGCTLANDLGEFVVRSLCFCTKCRDLLMPSKNTWKLSFF